MPLIIVNIGEIFDIFTTNVLKIEKLFPVMGGESQHQRTIIRIFKEN